MLLFCCCLVGDICWLRAAVLYAVVLYVAVLCAVLYTVALYAAVLLLDHSLCAVVLYC